MFKLFKLMTKKEIFYAILVFIFVFIAVWCTLSVPDYMTKITTLVESGGELSDVWQYGFIMLAFALGDALCSVIVSFFTGQIAAGFSAELRSKIYNKVVSYSMQDINSFSTASLITRSTNDVTQITMVITMGLQMILRAPIIAIWAVIKIWGKGWQWTVVTAIAVLVVLITLIVVISLVSPRFRLVQKLTDNLNRIMREHLTGIRVVHAFNAENFQEDRFKEANAELTDNYLYVGKTMAFLLPTINLVMSGTSLAIYWVGAYMIQSAGDPTDKISIFSDLVVFMAYAIQIIIAFLMVAMIFIFIPRAQVSAQRILEVLSVTEKIKDGANDSTDQKEKGKIVFDNVTFRYPDAEEAVLENINFTIEPGETAAFIGSTGSGKSTLINLVPRFYDVSEGKVVIDGVDVREYTLRALHNKIGYVSQKAVLFKGTLADNVNYGVEEGRTVTDDEIIEAMTIAQGRDIVDRDDKGIYQEVAQAGGNYSGGQKQRISIARAICRKPEIFIFDDSFSALDYKTDKVLRAELAKHTEGVTKLIVAQRIGTVRDADKIIVLDEGKMVGIGTHDELMKTCEVYQQIAYSQLSKEELENA